jgi:exosome complex RNA-binding protein Csl4
MSKKSESVTPGQRLGYAADYNGGTGTYERDGLLYASVVGSRFIDPASTVEGVCRSIYHYIEFKPTCF